MSVRIAVATSVSLLIGTALGIIVGKRQRAEVPTFAVIGLLAGLVVGLSSSPVIAAAIGAAFTLAGALLSAYRAKEQGHEMIPLQSWLLPFSLMAIVGVITGILIRANDLLTLQTKDLRAKYAELGFDSNQVKQILERLATTVTLESPRFHTTNSSLFAQQRNSTWADWEKLSLPDDQLVKSLQNDGPTAVRDAIHEMQKVGMNNKAIIEWVKVFYAAEDKTK